MTMQDQLAYPSGGFPGAEAIGSPAWWAGRSLAELEDYMDRGMAGGDIFFAASAEMERRERSAEAEIRAREAQAARTFRRQRIALLAVGLVLLLAALAVAIEGR